MSRGKRKKLGPKDRRLVAQIKRATALARGMSGLVGELYHLHIEACRDKLLNRDRKKPQKTT